jgi:chromosome segregation ATPase
MNEPTIICPTCETEILLTETLARPYIEAERAKLDQEVRERAAAIEKRETNLSEKSAMLGELDRKLKVRADEIESTVEDRLNKERATIAAVEAKKAENRYETQLAEARREQEAQSARIAELQQSELDFRAKSAALDQAKRNLELDLARKLAEKTDQIRSEAVKEERERNQLEILSRDDALAKTRAELAQAQEAELEIRRKRAALEDEKRAFDLEVARKLDDERQSIRETTQREDDERHRLKLARKTRSLSRWPSRWKSFVAKSTRVRSKSKAKFWNKICAKSSKMNFKTIISKTYRMANPVATS